MLRLLLTMVLLVILCGAILPDPAWARPTVSSWYGPGLEGGPTASGEPFNPGDYTRRHAAPYR
jgi:rare lipoprotein A